MENTVSTMVFESSGSENGDGRSRPVAQQKIRPGATDCGISFREKRE
jgi:hypothetical protein